MEGYNSHEKKLKRGNATCFKRYEKYHQRLRHHASGHFIKLYGFCHDHPRIAKEYDRQLLDVDSAIYQTIEKALGPGPFCLPDQVHEGCCAAWKVLAQHWEIIDLKNVCDFFYPNPASNSASGYTPVRIPAMRDLYLYLDRYTNIEAAYGTDPQVDADIQTIRAGYGVHTQKRLVTLDDIYAYLDEFVPLSSRSKKTDKWKHDLDARVMLVNILGGGRWRKDPKTFDRGHRHKTTHAMIKQADKMLGDHPLRVYPMFSLLHNEIIMATTHGLVHTLLENPTHPEEWFVLMCQRITFCLEDRNHGLFGLLEKWEIQVQGGEKRHLDGVLADYHATCGDGI